MPRIVDEQWAAHGDFVLVALNRETQVFGIANQRLFQTEEDAFAAMPRAAIGVDVLVCQVVAQHRPALHLYEIVDPRQAILPKHEPEVKR